jgi:phage-related protein
VSSNEPIDVKEVVFVGSAKRDFGDLPVKVKREATGSLSDLQNGRIPTGKRYDFLKGALTGIGEIRLDDDDKTYRVYNVIAYPEVVYVIDAGIKKSPHGSKIPDVDKKRLIARKKVVDEDYRHNAPIYKESFEIRRGRRESLLGDLIPPHRAKGT